MLKSACVPQLAGAGRESLKHEKYNTTQLYRIMATLEKIRSKSVLLIVIIGLALLAFIVGDALTNSRNLFGNGTTVAKVGSEKIDYTEYSAKREELNNRLEEARKQNPQQVANFDSQQLAQMAIDQLIDEKLLDAAVDELGIRVTGDQLRFYMLDNPVSEMMQDLLRSMQQNGMNIQTPQQAFEVIFNPKRNGLTDANVEPYQRLWLAVEQDTKKQVARNTYARILQSSIKANDLDKKAMYNDFVATKQLSLAYVPYGNLDEKKYPVSDAEMKALYDKEKNRFKVNEPTKSVSFIAVTVTPSDADRKKSQELSQQVLREMRDSAAQLSKDLKKEGINVNHREVRGIDLYGATKDYVARAPKDSVSIISENIQGFTAIRMGKRSTMVDSIQINIVQVAGDKLPSRVLAALNGGLAVDSIATKFPADSVASQKEQWLQLFTAAGRTQAIEDSQLDSLINAGGKYITLMSQPQGAVIAQLVKKSNPKEIYEFDEITYELKPSTKTVNDAREKLEKFISANNTPEKFTANASKSGYTAMPCELTQSSPAMPSMGGLYPDSRQVVRWVMIDGSAGEVSHIYESKDAKNPMFYAVAIEAEYDDFTPLSNKKVKDYITDKVRRSKAGDEMVKKFTAAGTTIEQIAAAMNVEPQEVEDFRFGRNARVRDAGVTGKIAGTKAGTKVIVVKGDDGVYAYRVNGDKTEQFEYNDANYKQQFMRGLGLDLRQMLRGGKKIENNAYKFEAGE